jgi:hypothetical protein
MSRQGKVRLAKWYSTYSQKERARVVKETTPLVLSRPLKLCECLPRKLFGRPLGLTCSAATPSLSSSTAPSDAARLLSCTER